MGGTGVVEEDGARVSGAPLTNLEDDSFVPYIYVIYIM